MSNAKISLSKLIDTIDKLRLHDHLCLIYESQEDQFDAIIPFITLGLARKEQCVYIVDDNTARAISDKLRAEGIDVDAAVKSGALAITTKQETYLRNGYFDPDQMIGFLERATDSAKQAGFSALRVSGEMTWALGGDPGVEKLMEYEAKLNNFFPQKDALAICQYNRNRFSPEVIINVIRTHPLVIYGGLVCRNFYYVPPAEFLKPDQSYLEVERLLDNLLAYERNEIALKESKEELELAKKLLEQDIIERGKVEEQLRRSEKLLQSLSSQLLTFHEEERKHIAQELHDSVGQTLAALKYSVEYNLNKLRNRLEPEYIQSLEALIPKIQSAVEEVDRIGKGLWPSILDDLGIIPTISWFCREFQSTYSGIRIEHEIEIEEDAIPQNIKPAMYRILQESLNNTTKHSEADLICVSLKKTDQAIELCIKDNGKGFNVKRTLLPKNYRNGLGLISMKKRAEMQGGSFEIKSDKGRGTTVRVLWPS